MSGSVSDSKSSELFNSTFYSSNSINTLDHARTFRNSLILKEMSDQSLTSSIEPKKLLPDENAESSILQRSFKEDSTGNSEVQTVNMTTSPSLSALADILNERSKYADQKTKNAQNIESSVIEEEEEDDEEQRNVFNYDEKLTGSRLGIPEEANKNFSAASPNLIDIDGSSNIQVTSSNLRSFEEPDFLSTPKVRPDFQKQPSKVDIQPAILEQNIPPATLEDSYITYPKTYPKTKDTTHNTRPLPTPKKLYNPKVRTKNLETRKYTDSSAQRTTSAGSVLEETSVHKKKKSIFSFLKRKEPKAVISNSSIPNDKKNTSNGKNKMSSSSTFSMSNQTPLNTPEKLKKKSHSSSSIFNSFLKGKIETPDPPRKEPITHKKRTPKSKEKKQDTEPTLDTTSASSIESPLLRKTDNAPMKASHVTKSIDQRKPTPLNMDLILGGNEYQENGLPQKQPRENNVVSNDLPLPSKDNLLSLDYEAPSPAFSKHDTGEVLFPKFLDSHEVDSIVSLERTRSTKSNKRSSMNSQRRSLTDTLSIKAQSEGMFITEASSVILSTPDLTKSPASSILKNGRFECPENFSREYSYEGNTNEERNNLNSRNDDIQSKNDDVFLSSIERKFDQLVMASDEEKTEVEREVSKPKKEYAEYASEGQNRYADDDNELISDIMEFASFINFGDDDLNLDLDLGSTEVSYKAENRGFIGKDNIYSSAFEFDPRNNKETVQTGKKTQSYLADEHFTTREEEYQDELPTYAQDYRVMNNNDFENEDFNDHTTTPAEVTPRNNAYLPEFEANRPVSMSFKGLRAPRMSTSFIDSMTPDSPVKSDLTSLGEMNVKDINGEGVRFSSQIILYDTYGEFEYDRHPEISTCNQLTPQLAQMIKLELNELKSAMEVHDDSRCYTHFY
ncbi:hypothetical protein SKDZ_14G0950 [Saccharomyces kudriavzevii ZP591]|nr:hypothetical protein SKDZ_14G0950 [Saccharomyces kudriavzevii ZP591]